jgi:hypothetical protein
MPAPDHGRGAARARAAIDAALGQIGFCLPGTITIRRARCGKPRCACAAGPPALHGPCIQWTRTVNGKAVTRTPTPAQYQAYAPWFANARRLRALATELQALSLEEMARAEGWAKITPAPRRRPAPAPSAARTRTTPNHPKRREISPPNPGPAPRRTYVTAGHIVLSLAHRFSNTCTRCTAIPYSSRRLVRERSRAPGLLSSEPVTRTICRACATMPGRQGSLYAAVTTSD